MQADFVILWSWQEEIHQVIELQSNIADIYQPASFSFATNPAVGSSDKSDPWSPEHEVNKEKKNIPLLNIFVLVW